MDVLPVFTILPVLLLVAVSNAGVLPGCSVHLKQLSEKPPLLLRPGGPLNVSGFAAPDADHVLRLQPNASLLLACPGAGNQVLLANRTSGLRQVNATCARDSAVRVRGAEVDLRTVECLRPVERTAEKDGRRRCGAGGEGQRIRIGFRLLTGFLEVVSTCFDDQLLSPIYSNYTLIQNQASWWSGSNLLEFRAGRFFGSIDPAHQYDAQRQTLKAHGRFLDSDSLVRAPLTPDAGPVYAPGIATEFDVNAAPQWRSVNAGAWAGVERAVRSLAAARGDLLVVTGVYGVTSLPDAHGDRSPLFLFAQRAQLKMPVPALYWKVVFDARTGEGAAVVGNNNPWEPLAAYPGLRLCADVCARLRWLPAPPADVYCCEVGALRKRVVDLPPLDVRGLLDGPGLQTEPPSTVPPTTELTSTESPSTEETSTESLPSHFPSTRTPRPEKAPHATGSSSSTLLQCSGFLLLRMLAFLLLGKTMITYCN